MIHPIEFYKQELEKYETLVASLKKRLLLLSSLRLLVFVITVILVYFMFTKWKLAAIVAVLGVAIFIFLLSKYTDTKAKHRLNKVLVNINNEELKVASGNYYDRETGLKFQNPKHFYSLDIDLFGKGSLFQYINRAYSNEGEFELAKILNANNTNNIKVHQNAIQELSQKPNWLQLYNATGRLIETNTSASSIIQWLKHHNPTISKSMNWVPWLFSFVSLGLLTCTIFNLINISVFGYWIFVGLLVTGLYLKKINLIAHHSDKTKDTFKQYAALLLLIEKETFNSSLLKSKQELIQSEGKKASEIFSEFSKHLDALDNRNNLIGAIFGNGYLLTDIKNAYKIEQWVSKHGQKVEDWFNVICFFDAFNSLGTYAFNHPDHVFPEVSDDGPIIDAINLGHPLLHEDKRISSDICIDNEQFFIVTGANMAGKSTFLRTVSLHIVMANVGLPVCAKSSKYSPVKLITSMRTSDSLTDESSYFFSELTRLKFIVDAIDKEPYFIVLDEILKGTNSTDKAIGSRKFVEKLVASNATGIIATHDLSLCEISKELDKVKNYYFDAQIVNNELFFDYKFKAGICQNMNASFLLQKMKII